MGESVAEATLTAWLKDIGDTIDFDEAIVEIATDKVDSEVPSEKKGILIEKCFEINDIIKVGETIAIIETDDDESDGRAIDFISFRGFEPNNRTLTTSPLEQIPKSGKRIKSSEFLA